jgi:hypothetical protein
MGYVDAYINGQWQPLMHATIMCTICKRRDLLVNMVISDVAICEQCSLNG